MVRLTWWSNVILAALCIPATYLLVRQLYCRSAGVVAVVLVATNPLFIRFGPTYYPHILGILLVALSGFLVLYCERKAPLRKLGWLIAGFLMSILVTVRPLTGVCVGASLAVWLILRKKIERKELLIFFLLLAVGGALPIAGLLHFNAVTNGNAFTFGYQVSQGQLHDLGFGKRGFIVYDAQGNATESSVDFTPWRALKQLLERIHHMDYLLFPGFMILPLIFAGYAYGFQFRWEAVLAFLVLPVAHAFYFYGSDRFLLDLLPFLCAGIAAIVVFLGSKRRSLAISLLLFMFISNIGHVIRTQYQYYYRVSRILRPYIEMVKNSQTAHGKVIIFVSSHRTHGEYLLENLYWFNIRDFLRNIIVSRDIGERNSVLIKRFPEHVPIYLAEK
jgi:4-amino-4-deoxy-L-arabinose transferase-like glycosyltransferase